MMKYACALLLMLASLAAPAQQGPPQSQTYEWPEDSLVRQKLDKWQDLKFGMIIHWGLYSVAGIIESWALCSEDWVGRDSTVPYDDFKKWYWDLQKDFNPVNFDPESWAAAGRDAGMKYLVFTTKHHDGFCLFDTKQTDFSIARGPFAHHPKADVAKYVFDAFRKNGFMIGAYFSKPDWHSQDYWWPKYATPDRNNNYDIRKYPWRWKQFQNFTRKQILELMTDYGSIDILWLDGGWVRPRESVNEEVISWGARIPDWSQDIDIPRIAGEARRAQPGLLVVDRTVHGPYENYQTPEQRIPGQRLDHPWESCMTLAENWGYVPNDRFKSAAKVIHSLIEIVAKGGSLLLGIGPRPDGTLPAEAIARMKEIGQWMKQNGEAIYRTRTVDEYQDGNTFFTRGKNGATYALVCWDESKQLPASLTWKYNIPRHDASLVLLLNGEKLKWKREGDVVRVYLPAKLQSLRTPALAFRFHTE